MRLAFIIATLLVCAPSAAAQERVVGLLTLPQVFGEGACHRFAPEEVPLYAAPGVEESSGVIRVAQYWRFPDAGGCEGLIVEAYSGEKLPPSALPTEEFDYEAPAAIVLEKRGRWFKLRLSDGAAWVQASESNDYYPLEALLSNGLTYITHAAAPELFSRPGGRVAIAAASEGDSVRVMDFARVGAESWLQVSVMSHSVCESPGEPRIVAQGWMRAYGPSGQPSVWFYSRGC